MYVCMHACMPAYMHACMCEYIHLFMNEVCMYLTTMFVDGRSEMIYI